MTVIPFEGQSQVLPWDGLLLEVRRSAYRVGWIDRRVQELVDLETEEKRTQMTFHHTARDWTQLRALHTEVLEWLKESRAERQHMANSCRVAIAAGLNQRLLSQVQLERETIVRVLGSAFDALALDGMQQRVAIEAMMAAVDEVALERRDSTG